LVRAGWGPGETPDSIDLEVQVTASSVGQLQNLEVGVKSRWPSTQDDLATGWDFESEPRDVRSAALSYDGREPEEVLRRLTTRPVTGESERPFAPTVFAPGGDWGTACYIEMAHTNDPARRIVGQPSTERRQLYTRYGLFGHDLEKGVVLGARLRGAWLAQAPTDDELAAMYRQFLDETLPLGP
jgi:hypothetical protein